MTIGLPAYSLAELPIVGTRQNVSDAIIGTFESLGWTFSQEGPDCYMVQRPMSGASFGETLIVTLSDDSSVLVKSVCRWPLQVFDWGQNKRNVDQFVSLFSIRQIREAKCDFKAPIYLNAEASTPVDRVIRECEPATRAGERGRFNR